MKLLKCTNIQLFSTLWEPSLREPSVNRKDLRTLTLVVPTIDNPVLDPLAELHRRQLTIYEEPLSQSFDFFRHQREFFHQRSTSQAGFECAHLHQQVHGAHGDERRSIFCAVEKFKHVSTNKLAHSSR